MATAQIKVNFLIDCARYLENLTELDAYHCFLLRYNYIDLMNIQLKMRRLLILSLVLTSCVISAQVYVQLEIFNDPKAIKYSVGDEITYQVSYNPGVWNKGRIDQILIEENTLILSSEILELRYVTHFMLFRNSVKYVTGTVQSFGIIWLIQGSIAAVFGENTSWTNVLSIGGGSFIGGWVFRKLFYKIPIKINDKNRLRIIDTRFIVPGKT